MTQLRALLLTDVVDSTKLAESLGDAAMAELWTRHDRVARDLLEPHRGREIDRTDGFLLLFDVAADAVAYALAYHQAMGPLGLLARVGVHVGPVILLENAPADVARGAKPLEVEGLAKPTAARVMSVAVGGQTLLTSEAVASLGATSLRIASHGHWRMKGVAEPVELFEVGDADAPFTPPPDGAKVYRVVRAGEVWLPLKEVAHGLPGERDSFVGRGRDLVELSRLVDDGSRLVSVLGVGGTGKTRLVTRYAWTWLGDWPGGAWFCDLSEARDVAGIASAVARALGVPLGKDDPVVQLGHAIAGRGRCLVVLDNFEQVARHAPETLGRWLDRASEASFVVTTREVLGLPGETALALAPLVADEAVALFVARAVQAKRDFVPDDRDAIEELVRLLDGLPLAIELAAARVRVMPPKTLLARMSERFKLLSSSGGRHTRQATLRGALDWSWELLSADEQQALAQLSVFEGGFTLEAAEAVLSLADAWPMDAVQALVDKSLVRRVTDERFDLLVTVQEYAAEKLEGFGGRGEAEARHVAHFAGYGTDEAIVALDRHGGVALRRSLAAELDNLVVATRRATARGDGERATATLNAASEVLRLKGPLVVEVELAEAVCALSTLATRSRGLAALRLGNALFLQGRGPEALARLHQALAIFREVADRRFEGAALANLAGLHQQHGRPDEARAHFHAALALHRDADIRDGEGVVLGNLGVLDMQQGQMDAAVARYQQALVVHREVGNRRAEGIVLANLAIVRAEQGRVDEAQARYEEALVACRELGNLSLEGALLGNMGNLLRQQGQAEDALRRYSAALAVNREVGSRNGEAIVRFNLANLHRDEGQVDVAQGHYEQALAVAREVVDRRFEGAVLGNLGRLHLDQGRPDEAWARFDQALALRRAAGDRRGEGIALGDLGDVCGQRGSLDEARAHLYEGERLLRDVGDQHELATLLCVRARLEAKGGDLAAARVALAEAMDLAAGAGPDSPLGLDLSKARAALEAP